MKKISKLKYEPGKTDNKARRNKIKCRTVVLWGLSIVAVISFVILYILSINKRGSLSLGGEYLLLLIPLLSCGWGVLEIIQTQKKK